VDHVAPFAFYADATALIGLARIDRLDLLTVLPLPIRVTARVWSEAAGNPGKPGAERLRLARAAGILAVVDEGDSAAFPRLDPGESTVLSAAAIAGAAVIVDERKARALIRSDSKLGAAIPQVTGLIGLILLAKRRQRIAAVRPLLNRLIEEGFYIGGAFQDQILRLAGEA